MPVFDEGSEIERTAATNLRQQLRHPCKMLMVPLGRDEFDDRVLGLLQAITRLTNHQLVDLSDIGGRQVTGFVAFLNRASNHASQGRFYVQQGSGDIHQHSVIRRLPTLCDGLHEDDLVEHDLAWLCEAKNSQGVGDLLERHFKAGEIANDLAIAAHEQIKTVLHPHQFFTKRSHHRAHRTAVRACQLGTLLIDHGTVRQSFVEAVLLLERPDTRRLSRRLGDVEQQVLDQFIGGSLIQAIGTFLDQPLELLVDLAQQGANRSPVAYLSAGQALDHT